MMKVMDVLRSFAQIVCLATVVLVVPQTAVTAVAADAANGERLAHRWCESCHVVSQTQRRPSTDQAPSFSSIAQRPDFDASKLALFLLDPHPKMPDMGLSRTEAADIAAYIANLKP